MNRLTDYQGNYNTIYDKNRKDPVTCSETQGSVIIEFNDFHSLNRGSANYLLTKIKRHIRSGKRFVFNLEGIDNIDAQGLALFLHLNRALQKSKSELILTNPSTSIQKIFWITEIDRIINIRKSS